jgi:hypothetical protein
MTSAGITVIADETRRGDEPSEVPCRGIPDSA